MLTNETRRQLLNRAKAAQFPGSILEVYRAAEQGIDILADHEAQMQQQMQVAQTPQEQQTGLREEHARGNTQASMAFPNVQPGQSFNTVGMKAPINVDKYDNQGHLVESYKNVPPGIQDLPTGPYEGTIIETPAEYQRGGTKDPNPKQPTGTDDKAVISKRTFDAFKNLDVVKDSYEFIPFVKPDQMNKYTEYDNKLVKKSDIKTIKDNTSETLKDFEGDPYFSTIEPIIRKREKENLKELKNYREGDRDDYVGSNILRSYEYYKDKGNTEYKNEYGIVSSNVPVYKAMDKVLPRLDKLTDAEIQEFTGLINNLSSPYTKAMSEDENFGVVDALKILREQDTSGLKKYREKMGLSKDDVLDLVQVPEDSNFAVKSLLKLVKTGIKKKDFRKGGYRSKYGKDPVTGTGKKPKGSGRRLYTDENPKDTVGIKFATPADARATVAKVKKVYKPFARKIQILTVGEQRAKVMGKSQVSSIFTRVKEALRRGRKRT